jgi:ribonucleoside-triphosphate reductase
MGCRTALPDNFTGVYDLDCLNTGNFAYTTLNLPLLALEADGNVDRFYELLDKYCDIARNGLLNRREIVKDVIYNKHMSDFLLQRDKVTGIPLYDIDRTTITLGFCGLYECMKILNYNFGENIIQFINAKAKEYKLDDGLRWSVIASPAESASHRFAMIIKDKYPELELQGTDGYFYLTNSSHIPVSHESDIVAHIRNADKYHPLTKGGNILHVFLGESYHDPIAIWRLNKKILATNTNFWAFTNDFTYCNNCHNTFNKALDNCSICGSDDLTVYSRITGYFVPVKNWNNGKKAEFKDRYLHGGI